MLNFVPNCLTLIELERGRKRNRERNGGSERKERALGKGEREIRPEKIDIQ